MAGILSFLLVDLSALLANLPLVAGQELPFSPLIVKLISIIQPAILLSVAILVGNALAPKVGLSAPVAEAVARGGTVRSALKPQIIPGVVGGLVGGVAVISTWLLVKPFLPPVFVTRAEELNKFIPLLTRLLYGGITEELLLRWGVMTFLVWVPWRLLQRGQGIPRAIYVVSAIVVSSVVFGLGHLPVASALGVDFTVPIVAYIIIANSTFGLIAGYLYWKKGLEAAMIAHMMAHVVIVTGIQYGT